MKNILICIAFLSSLAGAQDYPTREIPQLSTSVPLDNGDVFTSPWVDLIHYNSIIVAKSSSHDFTFQVQFSPDCENNDSSLSRTYNTLKINPPERFTLGRKCARVVITNDSGSNMTELRFHTIAGDKTALNFPKDGVLPQRAESTPIRTDNYKNDVGLGRREGTANWRKWGANEDVDTSAPETVWSAGGRWTRLTSAETLDVVSSSTADDVGGTGATEIVIVGIGAGGVYQTETVAMNGTTTVVTSNTWLGVNRVTVTATGSGHINAGTIDLTATTAATIQAEVPIGLGVTQQAIYHAPNGRNTAFDGVFWNIRKLSGGSTPRCTLYVYIHDHASNIIYRVFRIDVSTATAEFGHIEPSNPFLLTENQSIEFVILTDTNNTVANVNVWGTEYQDR